MSSISRCASAPLRLSSRYSSVLESALISLGREDAVVNSTRKIRRKRHYEASHSRFRKLAQSFSAPAQRSQTPIDDDEDPFASMKLIKSIKKKKRKRKDKDREQRASSPAVTRSASKLNKLRKRCYAGVLEMAGHTPVTRSMARMKEKKRSSLEMIEDVEIEPEDEDHVEIQKKLVFRSPKPKMKSIKKQSRKLHQAVGTAKCDKKAVILKHWWVVWPPKREASRTRAVLEVTGRDSEKVSRYVVEKRKDSTKFMSKDGVYVVLSGKMDRDAAKSAGIPRIAIKLLEDGIPPFYFRRLLPFTQNSLETAIVTSVAIRHGAKKRITKSSLPAIDEANSRTYDNESMATMVKPKKSVPTDRNEPIVKTDIWTNEQVDALLNAKIKIPTTALNFWAQVAQFVPGKSAQDCQAKTFEHFRSPPTHRKAAKKIIKQVDSTTKSALSAKIARAGSNKFKKQVRDFVQDYEKKHVDDVFETTPSKEGLPELPEFDAIKSPELTTPSNSFADDDSDVDKETPGLLTKLTSRRRDDIDSYVLGINRQHVADGGVMVCGKARRMTSMITPVKQALTKATFAKKKAVMLAEDVGSHSLKAVISPGGTTHIRVEKDGSSSEDDDEYHSSEGEANFDIL
ncbi:hypothetical protein CCR75_008409 [Bremia lactucae]|uniref:Myb-like domain-containing protein n=1 Tax=Bremia lactucae TaxID=4779 RepID=A0A976IJY2_BRELC|nr:hypothetical protein CCR75_008409 [Bremia lactucae]